MKSNGLDCCDSRSPDPPSKTANPNGWYRLTVGVQTGHESLSTEQLRTCIKEKADQADYHCAIALLDQLILRHPESAVDYNNRGLMYFKQEDYERAIKDFEQAIALNPYLDKAYNNRANCQAELGYLLSALGDYETALDLNPYNQRAWINKGMTLRELGKYDLALETFDFALILQKTLQGRIYGERGYTYYLRGDWNCAIADYYRALSALSEGDGHRYKIQEWLSDLLNSTLV